MTDAGQLERASAYGSRPLADIVRELQRHHELIITYEDIRYEHPNDLEDITDQVSRVRNPPHRIVAARARAFEFEYDRPGDHGDAETVLRRLVQEYNGLAGASGLFSVEREAGVFHVLPATVRRANGQLAPQRSLLSYPVTLIRRERTGLDALREIADAVTRASGIDVGLNAPANLLLQTRVQIGAENESARSVILRLFAATGTRLSWRLLCDPGRQVCGLNIVLLG